MIKQEFFQFVNTWNGGTYISLNLYELSSKFPDQFQVAFNHIIAVDSFLLILIQLITWEHFLTCSIQLQLKMHEEWVKLLFDKTQ